MKKSQWFLLLMVSMIFAFNCNGQMTHLNAFRCTTFVYNLNTEEMRIRDICYEIHLISHNDLNEFNFTGTRDKTRDFWKFHISITDHEKFTESSLDASFYIYEENSEIIQYICIIESAEIKALIYNKTNSCWQILVLQNENYKMLSCYSGYRFIDIFNIKPKTKSGLDY